MQALLDVFCVTPTVLDACVAGTDAGCTATLLDALRAGQGAAVYGMLVAALLLGACGVPIPEEAVFAVGGALAASGRTSWLVVYALGWSVVLALDLVLHHVGARYGSGLEHSRLGRRVGPRRWADLRRFVARRGVWAVIGARFVMGLRIPAFLLAGAMDMPRARFLGAVACAGLVTAAIPLALGYLFGAHLDAILGGLVTARWVLLGAFVVVALWWLVRRRPYHPRMPELLLRDATLETALHAAGLRSAADLLALGAADEPRRFVGFVALPVAGTQGRFHLKRYRYRGWRQSRGLLGRGTLWGTPPEINEYRVLSLLRQAGVAAVRPVAACAVTRRGRLVAHALLTEVVPDALDLAARLRAADDPLAASSALRRAAATELGAQLARMHAAGLVHRDCHARNVLTAVSDAGVRVTFLDCRRGGRSRGAKDALLDLATLDRDLRGVLTRGERRKALGAYLGARDDAKDVVARVAAIREKLPPRRP